MANNLIASAVKSGETHLCLIAMPVVSDFKSEAIPDDVS